MDGRYLVDFYLPHPSDFRYNAINKWFWLQYHSQEDIIGPTSSAYTRYIWPLETSEAYAHQHQLLPYRKFLNLTHLDTYILGPFNFATIHGRKSCNRIPQSTWAILKSHSDMFHNPIPWFDVPTTPFMSIKVPTHHVIAPRMQVTWSSWLNVLFGPLVNAFTPDKKCLGYRYYPPFFFKSQ